MNKIEFNTQIATTIEQSNRLMELGLKPETADCYYSYEVEEHGENRFWEIIVSDWEPYWEITNNTIPAWSLHRLITMLPLKIEDVYSQESFLKIEGSDIVYKERDIYIYNSFEKNNIYDNIIDCIEWLIKDYYFNKNYLK